MAKGQQRGNREAKKPKAEKPKAAPVPTFAAAQQKPKPGGAGGKK